MKRWLFILACAPLSTAFAQLQLAPSGDAKPPELKPIVGPVAVPWPMWQVALVALALGALAALIVWLVARSMKNRPPPIPLTSRQIALRDLDALQPRIATDSPYAFSVAVCDVLRTYVFNQFRLSAPRLTSPELLASIADSPRFSAHEQELLTQFLEKCDLIKFANLNATSSDSEALWQQARNFVKGVLE